jgi:FtsH-binding integral membrane protein
MTRRGFNMLVGLLLLFGFGVLAVSSWIALQPSFAGIIANYGAGIAIGGLAGTILGLVAMWLGGRSHSAVFMGIGYLLFTVAFGATTSFVLPRYGIDTITNAFVATAAISVVFSVLGIVFPRFFERIIGAVFAIFLGVLLVSVVMAFMGIPCTWIDYVTVAIFAIFIGYDVHVGATIEPNICNAFVVATNIFLDIVNIFLTLLDIFNND